MVDDDPALGEMCTELLKSKGYAADAVTNGADAIERISKDPEYAIVLTDFVMPEMDGIQLLSKIKQINSAIDVIVMTSYGTVSSAVEAMKHGASDYITKPFKRDELVLVIEKILQMQRLEGEVDRLRSELGEKYTFGNIIGESPKIKKIYDIISHVSGTEANILIQGETGTGKELVAKAIHYNSARNNHRFVKVDCSSLTETLLESELFGHEKGAFTGATKDRVGRFRKADHGTIFLDEIGNISLAVQAKLLRVLQDSEFEAVGSDESIKVDVRIIAATNADLEGCVEKGLFRSDLFYRLNVIRIFLPPLRERTEDIPLLAAHFLAIHNKKNRKTVEGFSRDTLNILTSYAWPGNIRELENVIERAVILCKKNRITPEDVPLYQEKMGTRPGLSGKPLQELLEQTERQIIINTLEANDADKEKTAKILKISRASLYNKLNKYKI
ncbi:acetoacetate metabolism regulatory protein AtoC [Candidatus Kuenenia stuttgartiensis]|uniref:Acetoacetate metabolism regulatory protein AtoC n=1 Tax=Kuenenia stuttgartiensis TaxID=174633 RepID=A0A2C9CFW8_KUEST|nr:MULTISPECIES: sigma-54 dependent transcriptional regulator [Kuenenia]MCZ7621467.1 sigma-54 dependent transcriptional regulator [Candidatus Kuenenia sp.]QII09456.1 acetoacetate metabolism regulatory protein AtoC [Candidatus Kuenenia stuttgartiensis]GJQ50170.1 MAG: sigma-54-dependent Fis family transcriptional regulator [Candidatus Kuenenia stuttgartiensis]SOH04576.1 strongly similar to sigma 54 response regulator [Candidatus Kuenenia stuttgartiensis]